MPDATGHHGFFYHFLDVTTGRRAWRCELSTIDTTILIAGALTAAAYFDQDSDDEREVRELADSLYRRVDWQWAQNGEATVSHGWTPEAGFERHHWQGYNEALILYVLGLGSPTQALAGEELWRMDIHLSLEEALRSRIPVRRSAIHASALPCLD